MKVMLLLPRFYRPSIDTFQHLYGCLWPYMIHTYIYVMVVVLFDWTFYIDLVCVQQTRLAMFHFSDTNTKVTQKSQKKYYSY